jgi:ABC-type xylose transport system permease subunit
MAAPAPGSLSSVRSGRDPVRHDRLRRGAISVAILNAYPWPAALARQYADENGIPWPEGGLFIALGIAIPVLIALGVAILMNFLARRTRFGRYVFAIGGNPEAARLGGVPTRWIILKVFTLMGVRAVAQRFRPRGSTRRPISAI